MPEPRGAQVSVDALDVLAEGVLLVGADGRVCAANLAIARMLGCTVAGLVGAHVFDPPWQFVDDDDRIVPATESALALAVHTGATTTHEITRLIGRDPAVPVWVRVTAGPAVVDGQMGAVMAVADMTALVDAEHSLRHLMFTDTLTDLASRVRIIDRVDAALQRAVQHGGRVGVLHVDLDGFRTVNDTFGTSTGDEVLMAVAERLRDLGDRRVGVGRVGVDEFLLMVEGGGPGLEFDSRLRQLAEEVQRRIARPISCNGLELHLTASIGAARGPDDATTAVELISAADRALRASRAQGRNQLRFHDSAIDIRNRAHQQIDRDLRLATARHELDVYYQPIVDLRRGHLAGAEALVRWHHPERGPVPPALFIPAAEATGSISAISDLVLHTVARDIQSWSERDLFPGPARVAVNISPAEFNRSDFLDRLGGVLADADLDPSRLELEITESVLMDDLRSAADRLRQLDRRGFRVALDDFGTGYSSLSYLHHLPLHTLKIDRRFVGQVDDDRSGTITRTIVSLAHHLGVVAVAEGVETDLQRRFLVDAGCDLLQGFLVAPPLPRAAFERFLHDLPVATLGVA